MQGRKRMVILVKTDWRTLKRSNGDNGNIFVGVQEHSCRYFDIWL